MKIIQFLLGKARDFLGAMFGRGKLNRIALMDILIHTSTWDGMPMLVLVGSGFSKPLLIGGTSNFGDFVTRHGSGIGLSEKTPRYNTAAMQELERILAAGEPGVIGKSGLRSGARLTHLAVDRGSDRSRAVTLDEVPK